MCRCKSLNVGTTSSAAHQTDIDLASKAAHWLMDRLSRHVQKGSASNLDAVKSAFLAFLKQEKAPSDRVKELIREIGCQLECGAQKRESFERAFLGIFVKETLPKWLDDFEVMTMPLSERQVSINPENQAVYPTRGRYQIHRLAADVGWRTDPHSHVDVGVVGGISANDTTVPYGRMQHESQGMIGPFRWNLDSSAGVFASLPNRRAPYANSYEETMGVSSYLGATAFLGGHHQLSPWFAMRYGAQTRPMLAVGWNHSLEYHIPFEGGLALRFKPSSTSLLSVGVEGETALDVSLTTLRPGIFPERVSPFVSAWFGRFNFQSALDFYSVGKELRASLQAPLFESHRFGDIWLGLNANVNLEKRGMFYPQSILMSLSWFQDGGKRYQRLSTAFVAQTGSGSFVLGTDPKVFEDRNILWEKHDAKLIYNLLMASHKNDEFTCKVAGGDTFDCIGVQSGIHLINCYTGANAILCDINKMLYNKAPTSIATGTLVFKADSSNVMRLDASSLQVNEPLLKILSEEPTLEGFAKRLATFTINEKLMYLSALNDILYGAYKDSAKNSVADFVGNNDLYKTLRNNLLNAGNRQSSGVCSNIAFFVAKVASLMGLESYAATVPNKFMPHTIAVVRNPDTGKYSLISRDSNLLMQSTIEETLMEYSLYTGKAPLLFKIHDGQSGRYIRTIDTPLGEELNLRMGTPDRLELHLKGRK
jgi:hypothetical protein